MAEARENARLSAPICADVGWAPDRIPGGPDLAVLYCLAGWPMVHLRQRRRWVAACAAAATCTSCLCSAAGHLRAPSPAVLVLSRQFALPVLTPGHPAAVHRWHR